MPSDDVDHSVIALEHTENILLKSPALRDRRSSRSSPEAAAQNGVLPSPRSSRKRTNDEAWDDAGSFRSSPSPAKLSIRPSTAPEQLKLQTSVSANPLSHFESEKLTAKEPVQHEGRTDGEGLQPDSIHFKGSQLQQTFVHRIEKHKTQLESEFRDYEHNLHVAEKGEPLEDLDWDDLEARYNEAINSITQEEDELFEKFSQLFAHFQLWLQVTRQREAKRAFKRFCTRVAFVKHSETELSNKQRHYEKVVNAFQNAMALLGNV